jgi:hypothetical protein
MNYTKPEVAVLGDAAEVIEMTLGKPFGTVSDGIHANLSAYDLDE